MQQNNNKDLTSKRLDAKTRLKSAVKSVACLMAAVATLVYGVVFATNLSTLLNPVNSILNVMVALVCYGLVALVFVFLWHHFHRYMTQAISGLA